MLGCIAEDTRDAEARVLALGGRGVRGRGCRGRRPKRREVLPPSMSIVSIHRTGEMSVANSKGDRATDVPCAHESNSARSRQAEVAESIALVLSSGLYDYTSCSSSDGTGQSRRLTGQPCRPTIRGLEGSLPKAPETMSDVVAAERIRYGRVESEQRRMI